LRLAPVVVWSAGENTDRRGFQWPKNPHGWTKFTLERLLESYDTAYGLKSICLRYFNAAGATERCGEDHDPETHLIPNVLAAAADQQREVTIFGNQYPTSGGTAIRDYIHVADLADAHIRSLDYLRRAAGPTHLISAPDVATPFSK
jgi:UDP-glucose 4-epimerase